MRRKDAMFLLHHEQYLISYWEIMMVCFENYRELVSAMCDKNTEILMLRTVRTRTNEWAVKFKACPLTFRNHASSIKDRRFASAFYIFKQQIYFII